MRISDWSSDVCSSDLSSLIIGNLGAHLGFVSGASPTDTPARCTTLPDVAAGRNRLQNGIQIFPGSVPIYRGDQLVGAIGVCGDGLDQADMISFLGPNHGGARLRGKTDRASCRDRVCQQVM